MASYVSTVNPTTILNPNVPSGPQKSFLDAVIGSAMVPVLVKPVLLHTGEPAVLFSIEEVKVMAKPFKNWL